ncbi:MAG: SH3 domain-containing protein [Candidatus Promineifilaceae bacterium]|nr:SH3 domain-containing protein [Candidatus Promineifilaceae bacterium]
MEEETANEQQSDSPETLQRPEITTIERPAPPPGQNGAHITSLLVVGFVLICSLLIAGLFLPPISLAQRLGWREAGTADVGVDPAQEAALAEGTRARGLTVRLRQQGAVVQVAEPTLEEATPLRESLPPATTLAGDALYLIRHDEELPPEGQIVLALPTGVADETVDLYGWNGSAWRFIPTHEATEGVLTSTSAPLPDAVALVETAAPERPAVGAELLPGQMMPDAFLPHLTEITVGTLSLNAEGQLEGELTSAPPGDYPQFLQATNAGIIVDQFSLSALLDDPALIDQHVAALVEATADYSGLNLDYQGVSAGQRESFTAFVTELAGALHERDKMLVVTLGAPLLLPSGVWDTGGQDWQTLGQVADVVYVQMPLDPTLYDEEGVAETLVEWATEQIDRRKISLLVSANAVSALGGSFYELSNTRALANFGELSLLDGAETVAPGSAVEVGLTGSASPLVWDAESIMYRYSYEGQSEQPHHVWLSNEAALSHRLRLALPYHVRGIAVRGLGNVDAASGYVQAIESYTDAAVAPPQPAGAAIVWTVEDEVDGIVASSSGEALAFRWEDTTPGQYTIHATFAQGDSVAELDALTVTVTEPEPEPEPVAEPELTPAPTPEPTPEPEITVTISATVYTALNLRAGPGTEYDTIEILELGTDVTLIGRDSSGEWFQAFLTENRDRVGWLFGTYLTIESGANTGDLPVIDVAPPDDDSDGAAAPSLSTIANFEPPARRQLT